MKQPHKEIRRDGQIVEGRVFEFGGYPDHHSEQVEKALGEGPAQGLGFGFHSYLRFID